jgi:WD40 repeat protein
MKLVARWPQVAASEARICQVIAPFGFCYRRKFACDHRRAQLALSQVVGGIDTIVIQESKKTVALFIKTTAHGFLAGAVSSAQFSPYGQRVVTASPIETARRWDAATGKAIGEPMKHEGRVSSAQFSPYGQRVVTASWETARLWDLATARNQDSADDVLLLADLAEAASGSVLKASGQAETFEVLPQDQVRSIIEIITARFLGTPSTLTPLQRFLKWTVSDRRNRTISPFSELTVAEWIKNRITDGTSVV